jgi:outer membrane protein assembly factor BamA
LRGSLFDAKVDFAEPAFTSDRSYQNLTVSYQAYHSLGQKNVLAYRGSLCSASGDVPFYNLCLFGQAKDIRGYAVGRYQDRRMIVGQVELRRKFFWKLGGVAYFGAGQVAPTFSEFSTKNILPGGGIGLRFTLAEQNQINFRVDYAWGIDSRGLYVGIAESF